MQRVSWIAWCAAGVCSLVMASCSVGNSLHIAILKTGGAHTCAALLNLTWKCWGFNNSGQLGLGDTVNRGDLPDEMGNHLPLVNLGDHHAALDIAGGGAFNCALGTDTQTSVNVVKCWGDNSSGQLGQGDTVNRGDQSGEMGENLSTVDLGTDIDSHALTPSLKAYPAIAAGQSHVCVVITDGTVKCWGDNQFGQLGLGDTVNRGDGPNEMGDHLPVVDLGTDADVGHPVGNPLLASALVAGAYHTCALLANNRLGTSLVKCWGLNNVGQLGQGDTANRGDDPNEMGDHLPPIDLGAGRTPVALAAGGGHVCALLDDATMKCWGFNNSGQLGQGDAASRGDGPNEMGDNLPSIDLGAGRAALGIAAGDLYTCALLTHGEAKCWGDNSFGQLGQGDTASRGDGPNEMGDHLPPIDLGRRRPVALAGALYHVCALFDNGEAACWGRNDVGQLGEGDAINRGDNPGEMGDNLPLVDIGSWSHSTS